MCSQLYADSCIHSPVAFRNSQYLASDARTINIGDVPQRTLHCTIRPVSAATDDYFVVLIAPRQLERLLSITSLKLFSLHGCRVSALILLDRNDTAISCLIDETRGVHGSIFSSPPVITPFPIAWPMQGQSSLNVQGATPSQSAPIYRVPLELWSLIFTLIPPIHSLCTEESYQAHLVIITSVCRSWRDAALLTPVLWSRLDVDLGNGSIAHEVLNTWMKRAGVVPKTLNVQLWRCGETVYNRKYARRYRTDYCLAHTPQPAEGRKPCKLADSPIAQLLSESEGSWKHVEICYPTPECFQHFSVAMQAELARTSSQSPLQESAWSTLRSFKLIGQEWGTWIDLLVRLPPTYTSFTDFLPTNGSLTALELYIPSKYMDDIADPRFSPLLCQGLVSLTLTCYYAASLIFPILKHALNLEELTVNFKNGDDDSRQPSTINSKVHTVRFYGVVSVSGLEALKFPAMQRLTMKMGDVGGQKWAIDGHILALFASGGRFGSAVHSVPDKAKPEGPPTLQYLEIDGAEFDEDDGWQDHGGTDLGGGLLRILHTVSSLKQLYFTGGYFDQHLFARLNEISPRCLPGLEGLGLYDLDEGKLERLEGLDEFVKGRGVELTTTVNLKDPEPEGEDVPDE